MSIRLLLRMKLARTLFWSKYLGRRDGAAVRVLASNQCGPGSILRLGVICGPFFFLFFGGGVLSGPCFEGFATGSPDLLSPQKPTFLKVPMSSGAVDEEPHFLLILYIFVKPLGKEANLYRFPA